MWAVEELVKIGPQISIDHEDRDRAPMLLGTYKGVIDLTNGSIADGQREQSITRHTAIAPAANTSARWHQFLIDATNGDLDYMTYLARIVGCFLTASTKEHAMFFIYGPGGTGKSVFAETISTLLGSYSATARMDTFASGKDEHSTAIARLAGSQN